MPKGERFLILSIWDLGGCCLIMWWRLRVERSWSHAGHIFVDEFLLSINFGDRAVDLYGGVGLGSCCDVQVVCMDGSLLLAQLGAGVVCARGFCGAEVSTWP